MEVKRGKSVAPFVIVGIILFLIIVSISFYFLKDVINLKTFGEDEDEGGAFPSEESLVGPGGCRGDECAAYCQQNQIECQEWCNENPNSCPEEMKKFLGGGAFGEGFVGPGGCRGPDCEQICQQNPQICMRWCEQNQELCSQMMSGGFGGGAGATEIVEPPNTVITFTKSVNVFEGQFDDKVAIRARGLGANMVTIWPNRRLENDEFIFFPERVASMVNAAHKNGLQVELRSSYGIGEEIQNYEKFKANALKHVAEYAKFAEKYKVYRIVPFGEIDNQLSEHPNKIEELSQELLTEMRKHYSGKIGVGVAAPWRDTGFKFRGYDYLTISAYPHNDLATSINWAMAVAARSDIFIVHVGETGVINSDDARAQNFQTTTMSKEEEAEYYDEFFEQFSGKVNGISVFYGTFTDFMSVYEDPAENVVKEWYGKL